MGKVLCGAISILRPVIDGMRKHNVFSAGIDILEALAAGTSMRYKEKDAFPNNVNMLVDEGSESLKHAFARLLSDSTVKKKVREWNVDLKPLDKLLVLPAG